MTILISGPVIARLCLHTRKWAHEHIRRGTFGPVVPGHGGILFAELSAVEAYAGRTFTEHQIELAIDGYHDRRIILNDPEPQEVA